MYFKKAVRCMKIGDYVTVQEIMNQSESRWVVISDFIFHDYGDYEGLKGGTVRAVAHTKREAGKKATELEHDGIPTLLISGTWEHLHVGGVFVE
jgi:hypothetical protein